MWRSLLIGYQYVLLVYFSLLNVLYALFSSIGLRAIVVVFAREFSQGSLRDLLERDVYKPVSILVPAHNEEVSIVGSVQSLLNLQFPEFEIVVVSDGSEDETVQRLIEAFALAELPWAARQDLPCATVRRTFRSLTHPNLIVVDKDQGGKADSLNAALNWPATRCSRPSTPTRCSTARPSCGPAGCSSRTRPWSRWGGPSGP